MEYQHPIRGQFMARSALAQPDRWKPFLAMLARKGKARVSVLAVLEQTDRVAGRFSGEFVAFRGTAKGHA
jgi:thioesterase domain-containing protein